MQLRPLKTQWKRRASLIQCQPTEIGTTASVASVGYAFQQQRWVFFSDSTVLFCGRGAEVQVTVFMRMCVVFWSVSQKGHGELLCCDGCPKAFHMEWYLLHAGVPLAWATLHHHTARRGMCSQSRTFNMHLYSHTHNLPHSPFLPPDFA